MSAKSKASKSKAPSRQKRPSRSRVDYPPDIEAAELEAMERDVLVTVDEVEAVRHEPMAEADQSYKAIELKERQLREKELERREHALQAQWLEDVHIGLGGTESGVIPVELQVVTGHESIRWRGVKAEEGGVG